jgi:hypothetical protein
MEVRTMAGDFYDKHEILELTEQVAAHLESSFFNDEACERLNTLWQRMSSVLLGSPMHLRF